MIFSRIIIAIGLSLHLVAFSHGVSVKHVAEMGVCENTETLERRCVIQASDCKPTHIDGQKNVNGEKFVPLHMQRLQNQEMGCACDNTPVHVCLTPNHDDPLQFTKTCVAHQALCDVENGSLLGVTSDGDSEGSCTCKEIKKDNDTTTPTPTLYGACDNPQDPNDSFCAFSPNDCESPYVWVRPEDTVAVVGRTCTCENVRTGGCVGGFTGFICALTQDDCMNTRYFAPISLKKTHGESCRLCESSDALSSDAVDETKKESLSPGIIVLIVATAILSIVVIGFLWCAVLKCRRSKHAKDPISLTKQDPSTTTEDSDLPEADKREGVIDEGAFSAFEDGSEKLNSKSIV